ncbi:MAG TPA: DNA gyrase inhibitor YacG [Phycisphaerales bacterium]|nr:DNA gyrase inhibitor YacG [Phycisphaerales bacterium]
MGSWRCPVCGRVAGPDDIPIAELLRKQPHFPFCSNRCRLVDLNAWLDADYRIEGEPKAANGSPDSPDMAMGE